MWCASQSAAGSEEAGDAARQREASACCTSTARRGEHAAEIVDVVAVFAGGDIHAGGRGCAHLRQPIEIVGGDRLLEPADVGRRRRRCSAMLQRLLDGIGAVGVDEQARRRRSPLWRRGRAAGHRSGWVPIFIFTQRQPSRSTQPASCRVSCSSS